MHIEKSFVITVLAPGISDCPGLVDHCFISRCCHVVVVIGTLWSRRAGGQCFFYGAAGNGNSGMDLLRRNHGSPGDGRNGTGCSGGFHGHQKEPTGVGFERGLHTAAGM